MDFSQKELENALKIVTASIAGCEKMQPKFAEGTSQHSLLRNRIQALRISESLLRDDGSIQCFSREALEAALPPILSIRSKTTNARKKHPEGSTWYMRLTPTIEAMLVCEALLTKELGKRK